MQTSSICGLNIDSHTLLPQNSAGWVCWGGVEGGGGGCMQLSSVNQLLFGIYYPHLLLHYCRCS